MKGLYYTYLLACLIVPTCMSFCQEQANLHAAENVTQPPATLFDKLQNKAFSLSSKLDRQTARYLAKFSKQEARLRKRIAAKNPELAKSLFNGVEEKYRSLENMSPNLNKYSSVYSGRLDSVTTSLNFLDKNKMIDNPEIQKTLESYKDLQAKLNATGQINKYLGQRRKLLQSKFQELGMLKDLQRYNKDVALYQSQIKEYKSILQEPDKLERKLLQWAQQIPAWKDFFVKNSLLGSMFALPTSGDAVAMVPAGLQTRAQVTQNLIDRFGSLGAVNEVMQQQIPAAQSQLKQLKDRLGKYANGSIGGGGSSADMPNYQINPERSKSFWRRIYLSAGMQSQKAYSVLPVTSDISLALNFKWSEKRVIGVGISEKIGWGKSWKDLRISHQGTGIKSFADVKLKSSFWLSAGYELNYRRGLSALDSLADVHGTAVNRWSRSGLVGISKIVSLKGKVAKKTKIQVLWDFLSYSQLPRTPAFVWRVEYAFK